MFFKKLIIVAIAALCLAKVCEGIHCYKCSSINEPNCQEDKFAEGNRVSKIDCSNTQRPNYLPPGPSVTKCSKVVARDNAGTVVNRDCHWEVSGQTPKTCTVSHNQIVQSCQLCEGDYCNSAPSTMATFGITTLLAFIAAYMGLC